MNEVEKLSNIASLIQAHATPDLGTTGNPGSCPDQELNCNLSVARRCFNQQSHTAKAVG